MAAAVAATETGIGAAVAVAAVLTSLKFITEQTSAQLFRSLLALEAALVVMVAVPASAVLFMLAEAGSAHITHPAVAVAVAGKTARREPRLELPARTLQRNITMTRCVAF